MADEKVSNRWLVVLGALIIQISLGAVYIWSVFQTPLRGYFEGWTETQVTLPAQIVIFAFSLAVIFGGRIQDKLGPRLVGTIGGVVLGIGLVLARFTGNFGEGAALVWLVVTYAILGGVGIGMAYVCPVATCVKWFPDKRGLITGLAVAGFGAGAFVFAPLARALISGGYYQPFPGISLFPLPQMGVFNTFMVLGVIFLVAVVLGSQLLKNPPAGYSPPGWTPPAPASGAAPVQEDYTPLEMLKTPVFWVLWLTYLAGSTAGLMVIMKASPVWQSFDVLAITEFPIPGDTFELIGVAGAVAVAILAIFNAAGRIFWGKVSDSLGRKNTLIAMFILCGVFMLGLDWMRAYLLYLVGICVIALCFGGYLALYPAVTADYYGTKNMGANYGCMFTAYGAGGLLGPFLAAWLMRTAGNVEYEVTTLAGETTVRLFEVGDYRIAFLLSGATCLVAAALMLVVKAPAAKA